MAGGKGTRLLPATKVISKHIMPIYDKPMIYYPLCTLMLSDIQDILIISTSRDINLFKELLKDGSQFGVNFVYMIQDKPKGIGEAFSIGKNFLADHKSTLILGDNLFYGNSLQDKLIKASNNTGATLFSYNVSDPKEFAVLRLDENKQILGIEEKPNHPKSNLAITGLYFYDENVIDYASSLNPSNRGEYEITELNNIYLKEGALKVEELRRGFTWIDAGTHKNYLEANQFVSTIQNRQGLTISCPEEIAFEKGWIDLSKLYEQAIEQGSSYYGQYLMKIISNYS